MMRSVVAGTRMQPIMTSLHEQHKTRVTIILDSRDRQDHRK